MNVNLKELQRKYLNAEIVNDKIEIPLDPYKWGANFFQEDGIWQIEPNFISQILNDVRTAMNLPIDQIKKLRHRVLVVKDIIIFEFFMKE
jgi:hypothetical protein